MGNSKLAGQNSSYNSLHSHNQIGKTAGAFCDIEYSGSRKGVASW